MVIRNEQRWGFHRHWTGAVVNWLKSSSAKDHFEGKCFVRKMPNRARVSKNTERARESEREREREER